MSNCNILTSWQATCLLSHLILNSHLPLNPWINQDILPIRYQRLPYYQKKFLKGDINSKECVRRIVESETFSDNIYEKNENLKLKNWSIISSLESTISSLFQKVLNTLKDKCEKLMQNPYSNCISQIDNLGKETEN